MQRAYSINNVIDAKFKKLPFTGDWLTTIGEPEPTGSWIIYGAPKNGKTTFAMQLAKYISNFMRVAYDSVEEGLSLTIQRAMERTQMMDAGRRVILLDKETLPELEERLDRRRSPGVIIIDSVQFLEMKFSEYKRLKEKYPHKLFIYISHVEGKQPEGNTAKRIWRDANVIFRVEGFRAFVTSRYGGGSYLTISEEKASEYWGVQSTENNYGKNKGTTH